MSKLTEGKSNCKRRESNNIWCSEVEIVQTENGSQMLQISCTTKLNEIMRQRHQSTHGSLVILAVD